MAECKLTKDSLSFGSSEAGLSYNHADNKVFINGTNSGELVFTGPSGAAVTLSNISVDSSEIVVSSDRKFKVDISTIDNAIELCGKLSGKYWNWNPETTSLEGRSAGFIAQEIPSELDFLVHQTRRGLAIKYYALSGLFANAVTELSKKIQALEKRIQELEHPVEQPVE